MLVNWPSARMSRTGVAEFAVASVGLVAGVFALRRAGTIYLEPARSHLPVFLLGFVALVLCGAALFRIARRGEYPWLFAFAAIALPLFEPSRAPYSLAGRVVMGARDLALVGAVVVYMLRSLARADELERRIHVEAQSWSYAIVVAALVGHALFEDALPLRGTWVASGMLGTWFVAWLAVSLRYQR
jgi:hypothetical protein